MDELELFTVNVFRTRRLCENGSSNEQESLPAVGRFQNMTTARIIKGRILELEHSNIVGPSVKFKTVVNYEKTLEQGSYLGISFSPQDGYMN